MDAVLFKRVDEEIRSRGLKDHASRIASAQANLSFYEGKFDLSPARDRGNTAYDSSRYPRYSLIMQRIVNVLSMNLYARPPGRTFVAPEEDPGKKTAYDAATQWLNQCYKSNRMEAKWQRADALSIISSVAAFQVALTDNPALPVMIKLWDAGQFNVWFNRDDPCIPEIVAVTDSIGDRDRIRLYSDEKIVTYLTQTPRSDRSEGWTEYQKYTFDSESPNVLGELPFAFAHFMVPVCSFWCGSPGDNLRTANDGVNYSMTESFDCVRYNLRPIMKLKNVRPDWRPPAPVRPGDVWNMVGAADNSSEVPAEPDAEYLQADASFVEAGWNDVQSFIDHTLEMNGVPPSVIRMTQDSVRSGVAIVAEQLPLIAWAETRQVPFGFYEEDLARLVLLAGTRHMGRQKVAEYQVTASQLGIVLENPGLSLKWPNMYPRIPGQDQDTSDQFRLDNKLVSRTMLLMEREQLTREEAEAKLQQIADDLESEEKLFGEEIADSGEIDNITSDASTDDATPNEQKDEAELEDEAL